MSCQRDAMVNHLNSVQWLQIYYTIHSHPGLWKTSSGVCYESWKGVLLKWVYVFSLLHVRVYRLYFIAQEHCTVSNLFYQQNESHALGQQKMHTLLLYLIGKNRKNSATQYFKIQKFKATCTMK